MEGRIQRRGRRAFSASNVAGAAACATAVTLALSACYLTSDFNGITGGAPAVDAGPEASGDTDTGAPDSGLCAPGQHLLCSTFDNGGLTADGWVVHQANGGTASLSASDFVSPPASFRSLIPASNLATKNGQADLTQSVTLPGTFTTLTIAFDFRPTTCSATGQGITVLAVTPGDTVFGLVWGTSGLMWGQVVTVDGGQKFTPALFSKQPKNGGWTHFVVNISNPAAPKIDVTLDGASVLTVAQTTAFTPAAKVDLQLGANGPGVNAQCDMDFDNVTFDSQ